MKIIKIFIIDLDGVLTSQFKILKKSFEHKMNGLIGGFEKQIFKYLTKCQEFYFLVQSDNKKHFYFILIALQRIV